ncbi:tetratricopeptide-like helical [Fusarium heterosporum]|uniref:Tetratricopeptide-like helical n=1 Tax=Fusarium heterosporum TaxID=42747 RepID=A0A8H5TZN3_FUSHE|nr:tetratricopeptide-like helical [Fusarium heterosporum]
MSHSETEESSASERSLAGLFEHCVDVYSRLLLVLADGNHEVATSSEVDVEKALNEYGRLKIWGEQSRATLPDPARGSLGDSLRHDETLKNNVIAIFFLLSRQLEKALYIALDSGEESSGGESSDCSEDSSEFSDESDAPNQRMRVRSKASRVGLLLNHVYEQIKLLYHLEALLRRPRLSGRYLRSTGNREPTLMEQYDLRHIEEKCLHWTSSLKSQSELDINARSKGLHLETADIDKSQFTVPQRLEEELAVTQDELRLREAVKEQDRAYTLISRLARANTRRREQMKHWEKHPFCDSAGDGASVAGKQTRFPLFAFGIGKGMKANSLKSTPTAQSFSTVARSAVDETQTTSGRARTVYAASEIGGRQSTRVPDIPKAAYKDQHVECPYCHAMIDSVSIMNRMFWKRHVFRDLRPYTCTYDDCPNPDKMYATRHDWIYHEMQMHRRQWKCQQCDISYGKRDLMADHLGSSHSSCATGQLSVLLDITQHMEEIALFVLPSSTDSDDTVSVAARVSSRGNNGKESKTPASSLDFSKIDYTERPQQKAEDFASLTEAGKQVTRVAVLDWEAGTDSPSGFESEDIEVQMKFLEAKIKDKSEVLGKDHIETLEAMSELADLYIGQNLSQEAETVAVQVFEGFRKRLGQEHPKTWDKLVTVADIHMYADNHEEAEALFRQIFEAKRIVLGREHIDTLVARQNLIQTLMCRNRLDEAEEILNESLELSTIFHEDQRGILLLLKSDLAALRTLQGRPDEAARLGAEALEMLTSAPENEIFTALAIWNVSFVLRYQDQYDEAKDLLRKCIARTKWQVQELYDTEKLDVNHS